MHSYSPHLYSTLTSDATLLKVIDYYMELFKFLSFSNLLMGNLNTAVTVLKPKPKTTVLRRNQTTTEPQFSGDHLTVFLEFQKWPSTVTNVPKQQPNYRLSWTPASTVWSDQLTTRSGVARQPDYSPWQVYLCAAVGAIRTGVYIQVDSQPCTPNMWMEGRN